MSNKAPFHIFTKFPNFSSAHLHYPQVTASLNTSSCNGSTKRNPFPLDPTATSFFAIAPFLFFSLILYHNFHYKSTFSLESRRRLINLVRLSLKFSFIERTKTRKIHTKYTFLIKLSHLLQ